MPRESKFRDVYCKPVKHQACMSNIQVTDTSWNSLFCDVNPKFIAFIKKGAEESFMVIPVNKKGKIDEKYPFVDAHKASCLEIAWNPFNDNIIASCSEDKTVKIWVIPENGLTQNLTKPAIMLSKHRKRVTTMAWHPVANNILLTAGGDKVLFMWNIGTGEAFLKISRHPDQIWSVNFKDDGSQFVTTCKDKKIRVFDSHTGKVLHEGVGHEGDQPYRAIFVKDDLILRTGLTKQSERFYSLCPPEALSTVIFEEKLDTSSEIILPFYDEDTGLVYLVEKGDCAIRYYEITNEAPFFHYINTYIAETPQKTVCFQSKRGISPEENEINRIYKFTPEGVVEVLQFIVPRKPGQFRNDIYPYTRSTTPALTADEFMKGENSYPKRRPVRARASSPTYEYIDDIYPDSSYCSETSLITETKTSPNKFRNVFFQSLEHDACMSDVRVTNSTWDSLFCDVNPKFIAFINEGTRGSFMIIPVNKTGRVDKDYPFVDAHKASCIEIAWSPFNDNIIASCSEDTTAKVWVIPENGLTGTLREPAMILSGHQKRVNTIAWHPVANNILLTAGGENVMFMWNVYTGEAFLKISCHPDQVLSINFNYDGSQFVTTCKDKKIRVLDSHTGKIRHEGVSHDGSKPQRAIFVKYGLILTTGFTKRSERVYTLRAPEALSTVLFEEKLETSSEIIFPFYDEDTGLLYLVGKRDCGIRYYEINNEPPFIHYISTYSTNRQQIAIGFQSKRGISSKENEVNRFYKFTPEGVVDVLRIFVPRKFSFYQRDLYPATRSTVPALTAEEFMTGKNSDPLRQPVNAAASRFLETHSHSWILYWRNREFYFGFKCGLQRTVTEAAP